jgi:3-hydroxyisobutyrate dehydrogenase-like beta-hydroxyacid dehydrogenase
MMERMATIGFVGLGAMGSRMAQRLLHAEQRLVVWNRTPQKMAPLIDLGAVRADSPAEAAERSDVVLTMVADPAALRAVTEGPSGVAAGSDVSSTLIEMSTVGPDAIARLESILPEGTGLLDAPVLGSLAEAASGSLRIFMGGPRTLAERWTPLLSTLGNPMHVGPLGSGAAAKLVANLTLLGALGVLGEALALAQALGLAHDTAFDVLAATPLAAQAERRRPAIEGDDFPPRFSLSLARKDADLIGEAAAETGVDLRVAAAVRGWLADAEDASWGKRDYSAVLAWILKSRDSFPQSS